MPTEKISWVWYHGQDLGTSAGTKTFFQTNKNAASNGLADTNMDISGQFPQSEKFTLKKVSIVLSPDEAVADQLAALSEAVLQLNISGKPYLEIPAALAVAGPKTAAVSVTSGGGAVLGGDGYYLPIDVVINGGVSFDVKIKFQNAPSTSQFVYVCLEGTRERPTA